MRRDDRMASHSPARASARRVAVAQLGCWIVVPGEFPESDALGLLRERGVQVWRDTDPAKAREKIEARMGADCILIDTTHEEAECFRLIDAVRYAARLRGRVPPAIVGMTGATDLAALKRLFSKDVDDLLLRPPGSAVLVEAVMRGAALTRVRRKLVSSDAIEWLSHINRRMEDMDLRENLKDVVPERNLAQVLRAFEERDTSPQLTL
ncbi:hypothetical protein LRB11_13350 [Ectothiorhodospira haloalkaliphila]|uniref:hypothetical protein n=1 Tax=Ectothiorhodospira TaxID=1051 RepID=UPI001EE7C9E4|nr:MULTISPECIES: hypothetical protein [Ectothiorhodospira]MCG5498529.1 hypothetical protein [Ectothiorhodospira variabilis]MCG5505269.1 hypothetical protein [Ectothiorhodospira variabilis]MCG5508426.1 hypothetical protein [Ectothiorhodospira variabilis]MCG5525906.1 hypothetical protein [Ectothiorhodospira haloalkaliphila]